MNKKKYNISELNRGRMKDLHITEEDIEDLVITALNGGIGYWACLDNTRPDFADQGEDTCVDEFTADLLLRGKTVVFLDDEERDLEYTLNLGLLLVGIAEFIRRGMDKYNAFTPDGAEMVMVDAEAADSIFQLAMFGDIEFC